MDGLARYWDRSDPIGRAVVALLLLMSIAAWTLIVWKVWTLRRAGRDTRLALPAFWSADSVAEARERVAAIDREGLLSPLIDAALDAQSRGEVDRGSGERARLTRRLRGALHRALARVQFGQVVLASIGSTAPFVGLFGTVWGIDRALQTIGGSGSIAIDKVAGPVSEALVMTAAGLAVAIPAVIAYNLFGRWVAAWEAELEGFAQDLLDLAGGAPAQAQPAPG